MSKSKNHKRALVKEAVVRRWGKLVGMPALTETFLENNAPLFEEEDALDDELAAAGDEMAAGEAEVEAGEEAEASVEEEEAVERIVSAVVDAIADETGVAIEVEGEAGDEAADDELDAGMDVSDELDDEADAEMDLGDEAANRRAYNRRDVNEEWGGKKDDRKKGRADKDASQESEDVADYEKPTSKKGKARREKALGEDLNLDVIDDAALTEAVLKRVVERLLRRK
jgi:hypothetical protein